jgi:hypothetical protein
MKKVYLLFITLSLLMLGYSCSQELPYPIDDVKRGVVIDIVRSEGSDGVLYRDETDGNYKVKLTIPEQQGDYSFMKHAQILAVFQGSDGSVTTKVVEDNITEFPKEISINIGQVYSLFGLTAPSLGEVLFLTTNVVLKDGSVIPGWSEEMGYNNRAFSGWRVGARAYSYNVRYAVVCALDLDVFVGTCTVTQDDWWGETPYEVEVTKVGDNQLKIEGLYNGEAENPLVITIDPADYSISFDKQILAPNSGAWWGTSANNNFALSNGAGVVDACDNIISFSGTASVNAGTFSGAYVIQMKK